MYEQILSRVEALPGVVAASAARMTVLSGGARSTAVSTDGRPIEKDNSNALGVRANVVSHRYFETMNIPILRGRPFNASDGPHTDRVTIVTKSLADRLWPNEDPIGKTLRDERQATPGRRRRPRYGLHEHAGAREAANLLLAAGAELSSRASRCTCAPLSSPMSLVPAIREAVRQVDSQLAVERPQLLGDVLDRTLSTATDDGHTRRPLWRRRVDTRGSGLYGVMAHVATQRTPEIGIRLAMGAQPASIVSLLLGQGLRLLGIGVAIGLTGALLGTRYIEAQLFGVTATDPLTFVSACVVLAIAGLTASLIPRPRALVPAIRDAVRRVDSQLALGRPQLLGDVLDRTLSSQRMLATLVGFFGGVALLLAALGLYGVMAHAATQRTPEIGIRLAMGAQPASIVSLLLAQSVRLLGIGAAIGLTGALVGTRYIESQLFGVTPTDLVTFVSACVVLAIAGLTASLIPAFHAMRIDPIIALRRT